MDWNECCELDNLEANRQWVVRFTEVRNKELCEWVSTLHPKGTPCEIDPDTRTDRCGSYNWVCKVRFVETDESWAVRFPRGGKVLVPDEKIQSEIAAIDIIRQHTKIPVPDVKAWGLAHDNPLGLGPFLITSWVEGVSLGGILKQPPDRGSSPGRLIREDYPKDRLATLLRQIASFVLQLSRIDFDHIGSCRLPQTRPLTLKSHQILESSGIAIPGSPSHTFGSATEYLKQIASHDIQQLRDQLNSVDDAQDAREKYILWEVMPSLVSRFVRRDHGPFKLICDDFSPMNMIVNNAADLQIIAVLDWEWSYAGPEDMFWSPPSWLLGEHPAHWEKGLDDPRLRRYNEGLELYIEIMQEVEKNEPFDSRNGMPSDLLRQGRSDGSMWFYHIMQEAFNGPNQVPFACLRGLLSDFDELASAVSDEDINSFVKLKMEHLEEYKENLTVARLKHGDLLRQLASH